MHGPPSTKSASRIFNNGSKDAWYDGFKCFAQSPKQCTLMEKNSPWQRVASCFVQRSPLLKKIWWSVPKNLKKEFCVWCFQNQQEELGVWYSQESGACVPHSIKRKSAIHPLHKVHSPCSLPPTSVHQKNTLPFSI